MKFTLCLGALACALSTGFGAANPVSSPASRPPNIIFILADDMGQGDVSAYNPAAAWRTPNLDRLAREGARFTDAHSSSAVCTPSRYSFLTGRYAWRSRLKSHVLFGYSQPLIEPGRLTVPALLRTQGYTTAMIGKWHLGLDWTRQPAGTPSASYEAPPEPGPRARENDPQLAHGIAYDEPFREGPTHIGFDSFFGISASLDMDPYVWLRDDRVVSPPTHRIDKSALPAMWRTGPIADDFAHVDVQSRLTREAVDYLARQDGGKPFFLYLAFASPHTPIVPTPEFAGRTGSAYGDFCLQLDHDVGELLRVLDERGLADNTLVVFTADNGCSPAANFAELKKIGHDPQAGLRGGKADLYEGGHRVPFLARWPVQIPAGSESSALICQMDWLATCADLLSASLPADAGEDSVSLLPVLRDPAHAIAPRGNLVHHSVNGSFAIRQGAWKLCLAPDSGGWSDPKPGQAPADAPPFQLFDLAHDRAETKNLFAAHPDVVAELASLLETRSRQGRSTPGPAQPNTGGDNWPHLDWMNHPALAAAAAATR